MFNKEVQETGNVVLSQEDFNEFLKKIEAAKTIANDYEYIKSDKALKDLKNENDDLTQKYDDLHDKFIKVTDVAIKQQTETKELNKLYEVIREFIKKIEKALGRGKYIDLVNHVTKDDKQMNFVVHQIDKQINPERYQEKTQEEQQEQKNEPKRNKGMTR